MKVFKQLLKNIGGNRSSSPSTSPQESSLSLGWKRRALVDGHCDDTSNTSVTSEAMGSTADAPWRVESIRVGAPGEQDWWKENGEEEMETTTSEDDTNTAGSSCLAGSSGGGGMSESMDESMEDKLEKSSSTAGTPKRFHNCGLQTWQIARARWTARPKGTDFNKKADFIKPVNQKELKKILTKASALRTYELPRRVPLNNLVESYVDVWSGEEL